VDLPPAAQLLLTFAGALGLTGMIGPWIVRQFRRGARAELEDSLQAKFATVETFNAYATKWTAALDGITVRVDGEMRDLNRKVDGAVSAAVNAASEASAAHDVADKVAARVDMLEEHIIPQLREIGKTLIDQGNLISKQTGVLEMLVDEHRRRP
jgi:hypothetical protein